MMAAVVIDPCPLPRTWMFALAQGNRRKGDARPSCRYDLDPGEHLAAFLAAFSKGMIVDSAGSPQR